MTRIVPAKKFALCLKCGRAQSNIKIKYCKPCKAESVHIFDSQSEAMRYLWLKNAPHITDLEIQPKYKLYAPQLVHDESWSAKKPKAKIAKKNKLIVAATYTADFQYIDQNNPKGWVIEDYKPYNWKTKKPIIDASTQIRLNWLHAQCSKEFDIVVSYNVPKGGYKIKLIKPTHKE